MFTNIVNLTYFRA